jgi:hypothetical protein
MNGTTRRRLAALAIGAGVLATGCAANPPAAEPPAVIPPATASGAPTPTQTFTIVTPTGTPGATTPPEQMAPSGPIPAGLRLPNEGEKSDSPEFTDWITDNAVGQPWLLDACQPTDYPTDRRRLAFRSVSRTGPEAHDARQLAVYPSPEVAAEVLAGFRRALAACATGTSPQGLTWQWVSQDAPDLGDEGLLAASVIGVGPGASPAGDRIAVTRIGTAVFLAYGGGEFQSAEIDGGAEAARDVAQQFLDSL